MIALIFAHRLEAQAFLDSFAWKALDTNTYQYKDYLLTYSGEGVFEAIYHLEKTLKNHKEINRVLHFGLAGSLSANVDKYSVVKIRSAYQQKNDKDMEFKSFTLDSEATFDIISANDRIGSKDKKDYLSCFGQLVDRETWGYAFTCKKEKIPFEAYKIISDFSDKEICSQIKEEAEEFSIKLLERFKQIEDPVFRSNKKEVKLPEGFYLTENLKKQYLNKMTSLEKKWQLSQEDCLKKLDVTSINNSEKRAKEKTKDLLDRMDQALDPDFYNYKERLKKHINHLKIQGIDLSFGKYFEPSEAELKFKFKDKKDYKQKLETLKDSKKIFPKEWL